MRQTRLVILMIAVPAAFVVAQTDPPGRVGRLNYVNGPVSFQPAGVTEWVDAYVNRPLTTGDQIWVGRGGRAEIHVGSTALRLDSNTAFQFLNLDDQTTQIQLSQGTLTVRVRNLAQNQNLELDTPSMAFTVLRPGEYRIDADPDTQTTTVTVRGGDGEVTGGGRTFPVRAGQQAIVTGGDQITYRLVSAPRADGWDQWSSSRDLREDRSLSARYVSREMAGYEDLDQYGGWSSQPGYGQVWMPASVSAGWAPYHDGHWAWISPWGWTWVDDAPWGFAPYHYGRWASFGGRWGWIPGPYGVAPLYAPALVGWIGGGRGGSGFSLSFAFGNAAAVGWFPLGPREPYFPAYNVSSGYFGRVNNTNTVINTTTINNYYNDSRNPNNTAFANIRYANQSVPNAVMAVPQDRFANGRRVAESSRAVSAAQLGSARMAAAPEIAPQRVSVLGPRAAEAPRAPRPPASVL
ncbi:MAG: FecR domain-containing protein, partial [Acidobacteria bacterium]|nr:FecR domain-containing protein [Acidobacteriota bacterium]